MKRIIPFSKWHVLRYGVTLRGKIFSANDIRIIRELVKENWKHGRFRASCAICQRLEWRQPNGWLKDRACRDVLLKLKKIGVLNLPRRKILPNNKTNNSKNAKRIEKDISNNEVVTYINFKTVSLKLAKSSDSEAEWNEIVKKYHYLGYHGFVGRSMKYLIYACDALIGAIGFCDPSWSVKARDLALSSIGMNIWECRQKGINNGRFLIMPWIRVPNLASRILSLAAQQIKNDWAHYYSIDPLFIETFVDSTRFNGTCYRAANWICLGHTKGYKKCGANHSNTQSKKFVFLHALNKQFGKELKLSLGRANYVDTVGR